LKKSKLKIKVGKEEMFNKMILMPIVRCHTTKADSII